MIVDASFFGIFKPNSALINAKTFSLPKAYLLRREFSQDCLADTSLEIYEVSDRSLTILPKEIPRTPDRPPD